MWMDGCMTGWMVNWMDEWFDGWMENCNGFKQTPGFLSFSFSFSLFSIITVIGKDMPAAAWLSWLGKT